VVVTKQHLFALEEVELQSVIAAGLAGAVTVVVPAVTGQELAETGLGVTGSVPQLTEAKPEYA